MPELYDHILSDRCYTVRLALGLLGVNYKKHTVDFVPSRQPVSTAIMHLNPSGELPVLVDGDLFLTEIPAILAHLAGHHDPAGTWRAADPEVQRWITFAAGPLAALTRARGTSLFGASGELDALRLSSRAALRTVDDHLADQWVTGRHWIAGDAPTLADVAVFPPVMLSHDCGIGHEDYPAINLWQRRVRKLPGFVSMPGIPDYF